MSTILVHGGFALAGDGVRETQINVRSGLIAGNYKGTFEGNYSVPMGLDIDWEFFLNNNTSYLFRFTQAADRPDSRPFYTYGGMGMHFYGKTKAKITDQRGSGISIHAVPRFNYYAGADVGIAQVIVKTFGPVVQAVASMLEVGGNVGGLYRVTDQVSVNVQFGFTIGYGFTSTAADGTTGRALAGLSYYF